MFGATLQKRCVKILLPLIWLSVVQKHNEPFPEKSAMTTKEATESDDKTEFC